MGSDRLDIGRDASAGRWVETSDGENDWWGFGH